MSIEKARSIVLSTKNYRESSMLLYLFSVQHGRIHALAKGIRRGDSRNVPVERGYFIEHVVYYKQHRDLQQATDCIILEHYSSIRNNLEKTALRDLLFDVVLAGVKDADPHPELFHYLLGFLDGLNRLQNDITKQVLFLLRSLFGMAAYMGFALDFETCAVCGMPLDRCDKGEVDIVKGVVRCHRCMSKTVTSISVVQSNILEVIKMTDDTFWSQKIGELSRQRLLSLLRLGSDYCRYHLEIRKNLESLLFIENLFGVTSDR